MNGGGLRVIPIRLNDPQGVISAPGRPAPPPVTVASQVPTPQAPAWMLGAVNSDGCRQVTPVRPNDLQGVISAPVRPATPRAAPTATIQFRPTLHTLLS